MNKPTTPHDLSNSAAFDDKITVLNPVGYPPKINKKSLSPRPESLDGKTIYLVDCRFDDFDRPAQADPGVVRRPHAGRERPR